MDKRIIYLEDNGSVAVISPSPEALALYGVGAIARKDVPAGKPYKIIDIADLPDAPQETWTVDEADLTDGFGGDSNLFPEPEVIEEVIEVVPEEVIEEEQVEVQNVD